MKYSVAAMLLLVTSLAIAEPVQPVDSKSSSNSDSTAVAGATSQGGSATQGQGQGQGQGQQQGIGNSGDSTSSNKNSAGGGSVQGNSLGVSQTTNQADSAKTAFVATQNIYNSDNCRVGAGVGGQGLAFGVSLSWTNRDENCEVIKLARELNSYGHKDVAIELLKSDERVRAAFERVSAHKLKTNEYEGTDLK